MALNLHAKLKSFKEFKDVFDKFCVEGHHLMKIRSSRKKGLDGEKLERFCHMDIEYACVHSGKDKPSTSTGKQPVQKHNALGCKAHLSLVFCSTLCINESYLKVTKFVMDHNQAVCDDLFVCYPKQCRLDPGQLAYVQDLLKVDVQPSLKVDVQSSC